MSAPHDVGGVWYGRWTARDPAVAPGSFIALLTEVGGAITGETSERDEVGGGINGADVIGRRTGSTVRFIKHYARGRLSHAVRYDGVLDSSGTKIAGEWSLAGYRGGFTMEREIFAGLEDEEQRTETAPVTAE